jgi:hypothetical protein
MAALPKYFEYQRTESASKISTTKHSQIVAIVFAFSKLPQNYNATMPRALTVRSSLLPHILVEI